MKISDFLFEKINFMYFRMLNLNFTYTYIYIYISSSYKTTFSYEIKFNFYHHKFLFLSKFRFSSFLKHINETYFVNIFILSIFKG